MENNNKDNNNDNNYKDDNNDSNVNSNISTTPKNNDNYRSFLLSTVFRNFTSFHFKIFF